MSCDRYADMLRHYSLALDEIYLFRVALALELREVTRFLDYTTLPAGVRARVEVMQKRMQEALLVPSLRGAASAYGALGFDMKKEALRKAGAPECLTRSGWEQG